MKCAEEACIGASYKHADVISLLQHNHPCTVMAKIRPEEQCIL